MSSGSEASSITKHKGVGDLAGPKLLRSPSGKDPYIFINLISPKQKKSQEYPYLTSVFSCSKSIHSIQKQSFAAKNSLDLCKGNPICTFIPSLNPYAQSPTHYFWLR